MLTAITPTGDRLHQFAICSELMMRQTVKPDRWIIVDDGVHKIQNIVNQNICNMEIIIVQRDPDPGKITLKDNLLAALDKINIDDKIVFFEDDDFYPETYVEVMSKYLDDYLVVGGLLRKYYNLNYQGYWEFSRPSYGNLSSTAFKCDQKTLDAFHEVCSQCDGLKIDIDFWEKIKSIGISNYLHSDARAQVIGVKGWNVGRKGAVFGTHMKKRRKFRYDSNFDILNNYFGNFSETYKLFIKRGFLAGFWRTFLGTGLKFKVLIKSIIYGSSRN